jgi:hypothetical protein
VVQIQIVGEQRLLGNTPSQRRKESIQRNYLYKLMRTLNTCCLQGCILFLIVFPLLCLFFIAHSFFFLFHICFVSVFLLLWISSLANPRFQNSADTQNSGQTKSEFWGWILLISHQIRWKSDEIQNLDLIKFIEFHWISMNSTEFWNPETTPTC